MPIDKNNAPLIKAHILTSYGPTLERTLLTFILQDLAEIMSSLRMTTNQHLSFQARMQAREEVLHSSQVKKALLVRLGALKALRYQIIEEVIKQYNLTLANDESPFYVDVMEEYLIKVESQIEQYIRKGAYDQLHYKLNQLTVH